MPYISYQSQILNTAIGLWKIEEQDENFFIEKLNLFENELARLEGITHPIKRLEWFSSRLCLKQLLNIDCHVESLNQSDGKPYLTDNSHQISFTHSGQYAAVIASDRLDVAIDIEDRSRRRNLAIFYKFMNPEEQANFEDSKDELFFLLVWSAKETLFKLYGDRDVSLKEHIFIDTNNLDITEGGKLSGHIIIDGIKKDYEVEYEIAPEFILTYATEGEHRHAQAQLEMSVFA